MPCAEITIYANVPVSVDEPDIVFTEDVEVETEFQRDDSTFRRTAPYVLKGAWARTHSLPTDVPAQELPDDSNLAKLLDAWVFKSVAGKRHVNELLDDVECW